MNGPRNFDHELKTTLERRAAEAPRADLAESALGQARRIRRQRRVVGGVAVATVLAVTAPVGTALLSDDGTPDSNTATAPESEAPPEVEPLELTVSIRDLTRGADPSVPYVDSGSWVTAAARTSLEVPAGSPILDVAQFSEGVVVWGSNPDNGEIRMYPQGFEPPLDLDAAATGPVVDDTTGAVAFSLGGDTVHYGQSLGSDLRSTRLDGVRVDSILDARDEVVVFGGTEAGREMVGRIDFSTSPATYQPMFDGETVRATAFSLAANLMGQLGQDTVPGDPNESVCAVLTDLDEATGGWDSCEWRPESFSPDGSRVFALDTRTEGFGPRRAAVLDSATGEVLLELEAEGTFGFAPSWESDDVVDIVVVEERAAVVRCTVGVGCELATEPKPAGLDTLVDPYHLTTS